MSAVVGLDLPPIQDGLMLYLDAANPKSYPGFGSTWYDLSGNENHTTLSPGIIHTNDSYMDFSNGNNYVDVSDFELGDEFTFSCWINLTSNITAMLIARGNTANNLGVYLSLSSTSPYLRGGGNSGSGWNSTEISTIPVTDGNWHQVLATYTQSKNEIIGYVDGIKQLTVSRTFDSNNYSPKNVKLSRNQVSNAQWYTGKSSIYQIYNRHLTYEEIEYTYESFRHRYYT